MVEWHRESVPGRGIYCCKESACRERLSRNKKVLKAVCTSRLGELQRKGVLDEQGSCV